MLLPPKRFAKEVDELMNSKLSLREKADRLLAIAPTLEEVDALIPDDVEEKAFSEDHYLVYADRIRALLEQCNGDYVPAIEATLIEVASEAFAEWRFTLAFLRSTETQKFSKEAQRQVEGRRKWAVQHLDRALSALAMLQRPTKRQIPFSVKIAGSGPQQFNIHEQQSQQSSDQLEHKSDAKILPAGCRRLPIPRHQAGAADVARRADSDELGRK